MVKLIVGILIVAGLLLNAALYGYHRGYSDGYGTAMADDFLGIKSSEDFFKELTKK